MMDKKIYLLIFMIIIMFLINKQNKDNFINIDYCKEYDNKNQHCPYRVKYRPGIQQINTPFEFDIQNDKQYNCNKKPKPLYNQDLLETKPKCEKKQEFIMFAGKYPVAIKNNNNNSDICGK